MWRVDGDGINIEREIRERSAEPMVFHYFLDCQDETRTDLFESI